VGSGDSSGDTRGGDYDLDVWRGVAQALDPMPVVERLERLYCVDLGDDDSRAKRSGMARYSLANPAVADNHDEPAGELEVRNVE
jgi:hypothetical protein